VVVREETLAAQLLPDLVDELEETYLLRTPLLKVISEEYIDRQTIRLHLEKAKLAKSAKICQL